MPLFSRKRRSNFNILMNFFKKYEKFFILPKQDPRVKTNWLAFPLTISDKAGFTRYELTKYLEENNIQTRPIFTGNILKQPVFKKVRSYQVAKGGYPVADNIMRNGFLIGCHHGMGRIHLDYLKKTFNNFFKKKYD